MTVTQRERMNARIWNRQEVMSVRHGHEGLGGTYPFLWGETKWARRVSTGNFRTAPFPYKAIRPFRCQDACVQNLGIPISHNPTVGPEAWSSVQNSRPAPQQLDGSADRPP